MRAESKKFTEKAGLGYRAPKPTDTYHATNDDHHTQIATYRPLNALSRPQVEAKASMMRFAFLKNESCPETYESALKL